MNGDSIVGSNRTVNSFLSKSGSSEVICVMAAKRSMSLSVRKGRCDAANR
ncbi:hypothetical protein [Providencia rettgeri]|nr:hypothetical protein [Providencia rettgeri]